MRLIKRYSRSYISNTCGFENWLKKNNFDYLDKYTLGKMNINIQILLHKI